MSTPPQELNTNFNNSISSILNGYGSEAELTAALQADVDSSNADADVKEAVKTLFEKNTDFWDKIERIKADYEAENPTETPNYLEKIGSDIGKGALGEGLKALKGLSLDITKEVSEIVVSGKTIETAVVEYVNNLPVQYYYEKATETIVSSEKIFSETTHIPLGEIAHAAGEAIQKFAIVTEFKDTIEKGYEFIQNPSDVTLLAETASSGLKTGAAVLGGLWIESKVKGVVGVGISAAGSNLALGIADAVEDGVATAILAAYEAGQSAEQLINDLDDIISPIIDDFYQKSGNAAKELIENGQEAINDVHDALEQLGNDYGWAKDNLGDVINELPSWLQDVLGPLADAPGIARSRGSGGGGDPLVIDLDRDGDIELTSLQKGVHFDLWGDGYAKKMGWVAADDGFLAFDKDGDGKIEGVNELFGSGSPLTFVEGDESVFLEDGANGFAILDDYDSNGDGEINALDDVWSSLSVWQDINQNGASDEGELLTMAQAGIQSFDVKNVTLEPFVFGPGFTRQIEGNSVTHSSSYTATDGTKHEIADVWLDMELQNTAYNQDYTLDVRTLFLPTVRGYGQLSDLHVAASIDNGNGGLLDKLESFATKYNADNVFSKFKNVRSDVEGILYDWASIDVTAIESNPDFQNTGVYGQMPEYYFIKKFVGQDTEYLGTWIDQSPFMPITVDGVQAITQAFDMIVDNMMARLVFQSGGSDIFNSDASYDVVSDQFEGGMTITVAAANVLKDGATASSNGEG